VRVRGSVPLIAALLALPGCGSAAVVAAQSPEVGLLERDVCPRPTRTNDHMIADYGPCGFRIGEKKYQLSCGAVDEAKVSDVVIARGRLGERDTEVRSVRDIDPSLVLAIRLPGGICGDPEDHENVLSPWSMFFESTTVDRAAQHNAVCAATVKEHLAKNYC
jgi:hypothetical protein